MTRVSDQPQTNKKPLRLIAETIRETELGSDGQHGLSPPSLSDFPSVNAEHLGHSTSSNWITPAIRITFVLITIRKAIWWHIAWPICTSLPWCQSLPCALADRGRPNICQTCSNFAKTSIRHWYMQQHNDGWRPGDRPFQMMILASSQHRSLPFNWQFLSWQISQNRFEASLLCGIRDVKTGRVIWHGWAICLWWGCKAGPLAQ